MGRGEEGDTKRLVARGEGARGEGMSGEGVRAEGVRWREREGGTERGESRAGKGEVNLKTPGGGGGAAQKREEKELQERFGFMLLSSILLSFMPRSFKKTSLLENVFTFLFFDKDRSFSANSLSQLGDLLEDFITPKNGEVRKEVGSVSERNDVCFVSHFPSLPFPVPTKEK
jgi:hypothetical protein